MQAATDDHRIWIETAALVGLSALTALMMYKRFGRYNPTEPRNPTGDAPIAPWSQPKPGEKAQAEPARRTLDRATAQVDSPEKADRVVERLEELTANVTTGQVEQAKEPELPGKVGDDVADKVAESSQRIREAAKSAPPGEKASDAIAQAAKEIATSPGRQKAALADATEKALNPEQEGAPDAKNPRQRAYLREAVLKRMKPLDGLDARLFLAVNRLPRNRWLNEFFYFFTLTFKAGMGWYVIMALALLVNPRKGIRAVRDTVLPLTVASTLVEFPIKAFVRRRRPFIAYIQAIVIGKKPGSWSFPSGHSASAFAGAGLLSHDLPRQRPLLFLLAGLVAFSRIYLGDHYPGDVVSGALSGLTIAEIIRRAQEILTRD